MCEAKFVITLRGDPSASSYRVGDVTDTPRNSLAKERDSKGGVPEVHFPFQWYKNNFFLDTKQQIFNINALLHHPGHLELLSVLSESFTHFSWTKICLPKHAVCYFEPFFTHITIKLLTATQGTVVQIVSHSPYAQIHWSLWWIFRASTARFIE